ADRLARLLDESLSPDARDGMGRTLLHFAASEGRDDLVTLLLDRGADVNAISDSGDAPLNWAVQAGKPEIVALLRSRGAEAHDALTAAAVGDVDRLRDFLDADPTLIDRTYHFWPSSEGLSLLAMAAVYNQTDVAA